MKYFRWTLVLLIFIFSKPAKGQVSQVVLDSLLKIASKQVYRIVTYSFNSNGKQIVEAGMGIILNGKYFATCYHVVNPEGSTYKNSKTYLFYDEREENGIHHYDSMLLQRDFIVSKGQYDFSKHIYNRQDFSTDFIILRLTKKLPAIKYKFSKENPVFEQNTFHYGNVLNGNVINLVLANGVFEFNYTQDETSKPLFFACLFRDTYGFSGTPLYNDKGEIFGIIQFSFDQFPADLLLHKVTKNEIGMDALNAISNNYNRGFKLQMAIDFNFLKEKYLKGYL